MREVRTVLEEKRLFIRNCEKCDFNCNCERKDPNDCPFDNPKVIFGKPVEHKTDDLVKKFEQFLEKTRIKLLPYQKVLVKKMLRHEPITYIPPIAITRKDSTVVADIVAIAFQEEMNGRHNEQNS